MMDVPVARRRGSTMTRWRYTDTENTGAPVVPLLTDDEIDVPTVSVDVEQELEEIVRSHRLR